MIGGIIDSENFEEEAEWTTSEKAAQTRLTRKLIHKELDPV